MYFELFLLDDLLLNLLIMRLAAAMLSVRPPKFRMLAAGLASSLVSAAAAYLWPFLRSPFLRIPLLLVMTLGIPAGSLKAFTKNACAVLLATFIAGGCAQAVALLTGGGVKDGFISGGLGLRAALFAAFLVSLLPSAARRILRRRLKNESSAEVVILDGGVLRRFSAAVDTGNCLYEPVTGLPVAVIDYPAFRDRAKIPIPAKTAAGNVILMGFRPERISVNGREVELIVALSEGRLGAQAIVPPDVMIG